MQHASKMFNKEVNQSVNVLDMKGLTVSLDFQSISYMKQMLQMDQVSECSKCSQSCSRAPKKRSYPYLYSVVVSTV